MSETIEYVDPDGAATTLYHRSGTSGRFMPPVMVRDQAVPSDHGTRFRGCRFDAAQIVIPVVLDGSSEADFRSGVRALSTALNPSKGVGTLRATVDGAAREMSALFVDGMGFDEENPADIGFPTLMFRGFDPFWYDTTTVTGTFTTGDAAPFFPIFPLRLASSEVFADAVVTNTGDVEAWPLWTVTGPGSGLVLRNFTTGKVLALDYTLAAGDTVTIDTRPGAKTVTLDDGTNLFGSLTSRQLWPVARGSNSIRIEMSGGTDDSSVQIAHQRRFLSA